MECKKAIIIVDVQPGFVSEESRMAVSNLVQRIRDIRYDAYVEVVFSAPEGSIWERQMDWTFPEQGTVARVADAIPRGNYLFVRKQSKSAFRGDADLAGFLRSLGIPEVHVVGFDTQDCVLATAYDSFDSGFLTYVVGSCVGSSVSLDLHEKALAILDEQDMVI